MKSFKFFLGISLMVLAISLQFIQCTTREQTREKEDESGAPDAWNASINENANEMMEKVKAVFRFETFGEACPLLL